MALSTAFTGSRHATLSGGPAANEIDIGESITATFSLPVSIDFIPPMLLFEGDEHGAVEEIAGITATPAGGGAPVYWELQTDWTALGTSATWTGPGTVSNISPALPGSVAVCRIDNPFGSLLVDSLLFEAAAGTCGAGPCTNQSDYAVESLGYQPVPEPGTLLLLG